MNYIWRAISNMYIHLKNLNFWCIFECRFAPAHVIIEFTKKSLTDNLRGNVMLSPASVTAFLFVCRQLYNSCEGLLLVSHYGLHQCIANALTLVRKSFNF